MIFFCIFVNNNFFLLYLNYQNSISPPTGVKVGPSTPNIRPIRNNATNFHACSLYNRIDSTIVMVPISFTKFSSPFHKALTPSANGTRISPKTIHLIQMSGLSGCISCGHGRLSCRLCWKARGLVQPSGLWTVSTTRNSTPSHDLENRESC